MKAILEDTLEFEFPIDVISIQPPEQLSSHVRVEFGAVSDKGKVRQNNQDSYLIYEISRAWELVKSNVIEGLPGRAEEKSYVMAVADGMGGMAGGEIASNLAIRLAVNLVLNSSRWVLKLDNPETREEEIEAGKKRVEAWFHRIDEALVNYTKVYPNLAGMGTTLTSCLINGKDMVLFHIGDSRAYLYRNGKLISLTKDQTMAQTLADIGAIRPEEVKTHRMRHTLMSCLGAHGGNVNIEIHNMRLSDGDNVLLCSDGLFEMVSDELIARTLAKGRSAQKTCNELRDLALEAGGKDNVTVLIADYSL